MTNQKDYQKLKEIIQQANPEIMELKFGCDIKTTKWSFDFPYETISCEIIGGKEREFRCTTRTEIFKEKEIEQILGGVIRLADVLLALPVKEKTFKEKKGSIFVTTEGYFIAQYGDGGQKNLGKWNLKDNNLDNQSDETKQFLIDSLVSK